MALSVVGSVLSSQKQVEILALRVHSIRTYSSEGEKGERLIAGSLVSLSTSLEHLDEEFFVMRLTAKGLVFANISIMGLVRCRGKFCFSPVP